MRGAVPILSRALLLMSRLSLEGARYDNHDVITPGDSQQRTKDAWLWDFVLSGEEPHWGVSYSLGLYNAFDSRAHHPVSSEFRQRSIPISGRSVLATANVTF